MSGEYDIDFHAHPERYRYRSGEQGVFKVEPYKSKLLPDWSFKNLQAARTSVEALWNHFASYREAGDFVGMDMVRKYLQMGWTRALRYAKYPGGRKRDASGRPIEPCTWADAEKYEVSRLFRRYLDRLRADEAYQRLKAEHERRYADRTDRLP